MTRVHQLIGIFLAMAIFSMIGCAASESSRSTGAYFDDKTITTKVKAELAADSLTSMIQIEVETYNGVVQLSGFVDTKQIVERAEEVARGVPGVKEVKNNLLVR